MRILIVGGGVIGMLTAVECVSAGHEVVLLDQGDIPYPAATSFDRHRTLRALHMNAPSAAPAAVRSHHRWVALQNLLSCRFYEQVGALTVLPPEDLGKAQRMLLSAGSQPHVLNPDELTSRYPHVEFPIGESAVFESHAGVLLADRVLTACADWLLTHPLAQLRPNCRVVEVDAARASVRLADDETVSGDALLIAAGPWSQSLMAPDLAEQLVLYRQSMLYCDVPEADAGAWSVTPAMLSIGVDGCAWLVPPVAGTPLKLSAASVCRVATEVEDTSTAPYWRELLADTFAEIIPGFHSDWLTGARDCYYLARASTDGAMLVELSERTLSYPACGGSSFKFAPVIARNLAERLTGLKPAPTGLAPLDEGIVRAAAHRTRPVMPGVSS